MGTSQSGVGTRQSGIGRGREGKRLWLELRQKPNLSKHCTENSV